MSHRQPDKVAFTRVCKQLADGDDLTLEMVGDVFRKDFWMLLVMCFLDSQDAARAIQGAIRRISTREEPEVRVAVPTVSTPGSGEGY